jgi:hypothetical protein
MSPICTGDGGRCDALTSLHCTCQLAGTVSGLRTVNGAYCCASGERDVLHSMLLVGRFDLFAAGGSKRNVSPDIGWLNRIASVVILWNGCSSRIAVTASRTPSCWSISSWWYWLMGSAGRPAETLLV